ncbi:hypothetical protein [uncultured Amnibacterium sp.]|uniref:hypothetical protein n=1 Tax=uncultured Amnibacterium sp. TaxID=1631851 RepID=UPI0035CB6AD8
MSGAPLLIFVVLAAVFFYLLYAVVRAAVRAVLLDRWKTVRWFELTGEWHDGSWQRRAPRQVSDGPITKVKRT